jgi:hypothetical protein
MPVNVEGRTVFHPLVPDVVADVAALPAVEDAEDVDVDVEVAVVPMQSSSIALMCLSTLRTLPLRNGNKWEELDARMSTSSVARGTTTEVVEAVVAAMVVRDTEPAAVMEMAMVNVTLDPSRVANQMKLVEVTIPARVVIVAEGMDLALDARLW